MGQRICLSVTVNLAWARDLFGQIIRIVILRAFSTI